MPRRKNQKRRDNHRVIPVTLEDINGLLNKWERMSVRESTFMETWCFAAEAANVLSVFANRNIASKEEEY